MTVGFPDWSRTVNQGGQQLGSFFGHKGNDPTTGIMDCLGFAYLTVEIGDSGNVHNFSIVVTWYSDSGGTNIVGSSVFVPVPGSVLPYQIPLVSRYARVTCSHQVFNDSENIGCIVFGSNVVTTNIAGSQSGNPFIVNSGTLAGATNAFVNALYMYSGNATLSWYTDGANLCVVQLEYFDITSASWKVYRKVHLASGFQEGSAQLHIPACPIRIGNYNVDSVAHTFTGILVVGSS